MANREIKTTLKVDGESKFKQAMKDASNSIKVLNSEQKLADAQFKATGDAEQYASEKARILKEKIAEQEKAVKAAEDALKAYKEKGADPNTKAVQDWTVKLNGAKTYLANMQTQLKSTEGSLDNSTAAFDDAGAAADDFGAKLDNIDSGISFENTLTAIDNVQSRLSSIVTAAINAAKALWTMQTDAGAWADEMATAAETAGLDVETYQSWQYASRFIDTEVDTIINSRQKLLASMTSDSTKTIEMLNRLGIVARNSDGTLRDQTEVFWDTIDALGRISDETTREYYAQQLLGKSARELNPLINAGSAAYRALADEGRQYAVVTEDQVDALSSFDDANEKLQAELAATKLKIQSALSEPFEKLATAISTALEAFQDFLATEEGQAALANLSAAMGALVDKIVNIDFTALMEGAATAVSKLTEALGWIADHGTAVAIAIGAIGAATVGLKVTKDFLSFVQLLRGIKFFSGGAAAAGGAAGGAGDVVASAGGGVLAANATRIGSWIRGAGSKIGSLATTAGAWLGNAARHVGEVMVNTASHIAPHVAPVAAAVAPVALATGTGFALGAVADNAYTARTFGNANEILDNRGSFVETPEMAAWLDAYDEENARAMRELIDGDMARALELLPDYSAEQLKNANAVDLMEISAAMIEALYAEQGQKAYEQGTGIVDNWDNALNDNRGKLETTVGNIVQSVQNMIDSINWSNASGAGVSYYGGGYGGNINAVIQMDGRTVGKMVSPTVNRSIGAQISAMR